MVPTNDVCITAISGKVKYLTIHDHCLSANMLRSLLVSVKMVKPLLSSLIRPVLILLSVKPVKL